MLSSRFLGPLFHSSFGSRWKGALLAGALGAASLVSARAQVSVEWVSQYGSSAYDEAFGVAVDGIGQIWVAGSTFGNLGGTSQNGQGNLFLSRLALGGSVDFTRQRGGALSDSGTGVAVVGSSVFAGGETSSATFDAATALGNQDGLIVRYDLNGVWSTGGTRRVGSSVADYMPAVAGNASNLLVAGTSNKAFDGQTLIGGNDTYLSLRDSTGALVWTRFVGTTGSESGQGAAFDSAGNAYVAGTTSSAFSGFANSGSTDFFVARYDSAGNQTLLRQIGGGGTDSVWDVGVDLSGNIYLTGTTGASLGGQISHGLDDAFVMKLNSNGVLLWTRLLGGTDADGGNALALDAAGNVWVGGYTASSFGGHTLAGEYDGFVAGYDPNGNLLGTVFLSSSASEGVNGITVGPNGGIYAVGGTAARRACWEPRARETPMSSWPRSSPSPLLGCCCSREQAGACCGESAARRPNGEGEGLPARAAVAIRDHSAPDPCLFDLSPRRSDRKPGFSRWVSER